jgi:hypothetical protein
MHWMDRDYLPETKGNVERFIVNPDGEIDGVILNGAIEADSDSRPAASIPKSRLESKLVTPYACAACGCAERG